MIFFKFPIVLFGFLFLICKFTNLFLYSQAKYKNFFLFRNSLQNILEYPILPYNFASKNIMDLVIKQIIKAHGFSLTQVAKMIGKTPQSLFGIIENGNPSVRTLENIATAIGADITEFFHFSNNGVPPIIAFIKYGDNLYEAHSIDELRDVVKTIEEQISSVL